jgi:uncharacterized protein involved in exopolysaccharide biosynthesis
MELKDIFEELRENGRIIFLFALLFGVLGVAAYVFLPVKYTAAGSIFVARKVESSEGAEFSYEGHYAQLTARGYTETVIGMFESVDMRRASLEKLGIVSTADNLRRAGRSVNVKKAAPQLVLLQVKRNTAGEAGNYWNALVASVIEESVALNEESGDENITVSVVGDSPVITEGYRNIYLNLGIGLILGAFLASFFVVLREYLD